MEKTIIEDVNEYLSIISPVSLYREGLFPFRVRESYNFYLNLAVDLASQY